MVLFERLALKFLDDRHVEALQRALEKGDVQAAYREAHGLKGVAGNLSFAELYRVSSALSDALAVGDLASAVRMAPLLVQAHKEVLSVLAAGR